MIDDLNSTYRPLEVLDWSIQGSKVFRKGARSRARFHVVKRATVQVVSDWETLEI